MHIPISTMQLVDKGVFGCSTTLATPQLWMPWELGRCLVRESVWLPQDCPARSSVNLHHTCGGHFIRLRFGHATTRATSVGCRANNP
jgi:hypothetical protein